MKDYYKILDVSKAASSDEIKKAYRYKAKKTHPDKNMASDNSSKKMEELNEAYNILKDDFSKSQYDLKYSHIFEDNSVFYDHIDASTMPRNFYDEWKDDVQYKRIMIYLWLILGVVLTMAAVLILSLGSIETDTKTVPSPRQETAPNDLNPKEIYEPSSNIEENIKEI